jgi:hypothetical protein
LLLHADRLSPRAARAAAEAVLYELGGIDRRRLKLVLGLLGHDGRAPMDAVLHELWPDHDVDDAPAYLRQFRARLKKVGGGFELAVDTHKKSPTACRTCWFIGPDTRMQEIEDACRAAVADVDLTGFVPPRGLVLDPRHG